MLIANTTHELRDHTALEVLYVGQAHGQHGKRLAVDRLSDHRTFQRILAESGESNPSDEVLLLFSDTSTRNIVSTAGDFSVEPTASADEEQRHLDRSREIKLDRRTRVTLAEAALINYFRPAYNVLHKDSFRPDRMKRLKTLKKLFEFDLTALIVEINSSNFRSKLFSAHAPAGTLNGVQNRAASERLKSKAWLDEHGIGRVEADQFIADMTHGHIARFPLYEKSQRESFLHSLPWRWGPTEVQWLR